jgi:hypothetical protein
MDIGGIVPARLTKKPFQAEPLMADLPGVSIALYEYSRAVPTGCVTPATSNAESARALPLKKASAQRGN